MLFFIWLIMFDRQSPSPRLVHEIVQIAVSGIKPEKKDGTFQPEVHN